MNKKHKHKMERHKESYHTGFDDGFKPRVPIDVSKIKDFDDMLKAMESTAFGGRHVGEAAETLYKMVTDKDTFVVMTLSGAMTPAGMGLLICEMIDRGFVHAIVSTGALMTHGFVESSGMTHFQYKKHEMNDVELFNQGYDRIYDVLELEKNLDDVEKIVKKVLADIDPDTVLSSRYLNEILGKWLIDNSSGRGILKSAYNKKVPVYIPALTDSELGLDISLYNRRLIDEGKKPLNFNPFLDLEHYVEMINQQKKLAIFTIGGGVPRNWAQQVAPYLELLLSRNTRDDTEKNGNYPNIKRFAYALRICPERVEWGGLSGCTYEEGKSWGKFEEECVYTESLQDATVVWPMIVKGVIQRIQKNGKKINKSFNLKKQTARADEFVKNYLK